MKKIIISLAAVLIVVSCKGPGSGPLVKETFNHEGMDMNKAMETQKPSGVVQAEKANIKIEPGEGCIKISDLLANKKTYKGKTIKVKGQVTKFNPQIMNKNWVHIQDGSEFEGAFDLTITTDKIVNVGDVITFEGKISLDKDFGYGYLYSVLMEDGKAVL